MALILYCLTYMLAVQILSVNGVKTADTSSDAERKIDNFINNLLQLRDIPGAIFAAVKDGKLFLSKGYGKADVAKNIDMTDKTLLNIGSATKAFNAVLLAKLMAQKQSVNWDTSAREIIGDWFHFSRGYRSNETKIRDLLAHTTGVPRNDMTWLLDGHSRVELMRRMRFFEPIYSLRKSFLYNNLMYTVAGYTAEKLGGEEGETAWETLIQRHIYNTLGMNSSTFVHMTKKDHPQLAVPYLKVQGKRLEVPRAVYQGLRSCSPAGSIVSNAEDMGKWLLFLLNGGKNQHGDQIVKPEDMAEIFRPDFMLLFPNLIRPENPVAFTSDLYGKGWFGGHYRGYRLFQHGGDLPGYHSMVLLLPDRGLGLFISFNQAPSPEDRFLTLVYAADIISGETPWINVTSLSNENYRFHGPDFPSTDILRNMLIKSSSTPVDVCMPLRPLVDYVGEYGNFAYGNLTVLLNASTDQLHMNYGRTGNFKLYSMEDDVFWAQGGPKNLVALGPITFNCTTAPKKVDMVTIPGFEQSKPPSFLRGLKLSDAPPPNIHDC